MSAADTPTSNDEPQKKKPKRTYRACYPCRSRKLKCSFGDPDRPWNGPCVRCIREQRECVRSMPTVVRYSLPDADGVSVAQDIGEPTPPQSAPSIVTTDELPSTRVRPVLPRPPPSSFHSSPRDDSRYDGPSTHRRVRSPASNSGDEDGGSALVSSNLQNPNDALRLLAATSSLRYRAHDENHGSPNNVVQTGPRGNVLQWWPPIAEGNLSEHEAEALLYFFQLRMTPLYPLLHPAIFEPDYLETLVQNESLLLGAIIVISSRYSNVLEPSRGGAIHTKVAKWIRSELSALLDGDASLRAVSTIEALLLLSEWPMLPLPQRRRDGPDSEEARLLRPSLRYDALAWGYIGWAVRLAGELGMEDVVFNLPPATKLSDSWKQERILKTYIFCYNSEQHIATRLGRNAVMQPNKSTAWWESISREVNAKGTSTDAWRSDLVPPACNAQLMASIQQHLYWSKELTHTLLRTGAWESFMRSLRLDMRYSSNSCKSKLNAGTVGGSLLQLEFDYMVLYANSLALRSLQGRMRRGREANDPAWENPSLLNMVEGPWIIEALSAARSIIDIALNVLEKNHYLRYCPSRTFQCILFATTFLYKALATGVVEHGESPIVGLLERTVSALSTAAIDAEHFLAGFAVLLARLGKHWHGQTTDSSGVFRRPVSSAESTPTPYPTNAPMATATNSGNLVPPMPTAATMPINGGADGGMGSGGDTMGLHSHANVHQHQHQHQHSIPPVLDNAQPSVIADSFMWQLDLTSHMPAADLEQDMLFQSIWNAHSDASITSSNLYATLLGGAALDFPEGG